MAMGSAKRVLVGLSGGVDSSVAAALLKERGYAVEGAFIVPWSPEWLPCTWREERLDAMRVAAQLGIPFHTVDLSKEYDRDVAQYFIREYAAGRTPNPDVMCNKHIKFGAFFEWAMGQGFEFVATGHYARVAQVTGERLQVTENKADVRSLNLKPITYNLRAGADTSKDQTYFLWTLTQQHLLHTLFPIGDFHKTKVRELAAKYGLSTATKKDSQGVCFLGKLDMKEFLTHYIAVEPGTVLDEAGKVIGEHSGALLYTLGERHGFTVRHTSPHSEPLYVVAKDLEANTITVAPRQTTKVHAKSTVHLAQCNWIAPSFPITSNLAPVTCRARYRYRQPLLPVTVEAYTDSTAIVTFTEAQPYVASGQSLVLYNGDMCLGGGVIV